MFSFNCSYIDPVDAEQILISSKFIFLIRSVFSIDIIRGNNQEMSKDSLMKQGSKIIDNICTALKLDDFILDPIEYSSILITQKRYELEKRFNALIELQVKQEIDFIFSVLLLRNYKPHCELVYERDLIFQNQNDDLEKISCYLNTQSHKFDYSSELFDISLSKVEFSSYLPKLLEIPTEECLGK